MTPLFIEYHLSRSITPHRTVNIAWHSRLGRSAAARQAHCDACPQRSIVRSQGRGITREQERLLCFLVCGYSWGNTTRAHSSLKPAPRSRICYLSLHRNLERQRWGRSLSLRVGAQPYRRRWRPGSVFRGVFSGSRGSDCSLHRALCVFTLANHSGCLDETNTERRHTGHTEINHVGVFLKHSV